MGQRERDLVPIVNWHRNSRLDPRLRGDDIGGVAS